MNFFARFKKIFLVLLFLGVVFWLATCFGAFSSAPV